MSKLPTTLRMLIPVSLTTASNAANSIAYLLITCDPRDPRLGGALNARPTFPKRNHCCNRHRCGNVNCSFQRTISTSINNCRSNQCPTCKTTMEAADLSNHQATCTFPWWSDNVTVAPLLHVQIWPLIHTCERLEIQISEPKLRPKSSDRSRSISKALPFSVPTQLFPDHRPYYVS